jgi:hypothetical protein
MLLILRFLRFWYVFFTLLLPLVPSYRVERVP